MTFSGSQQQFESFGKPCRVSTTCIDTMHMYCYVTLWCPADRRRSKTAIACTVESVGTCRSRVYWILYGVHKVMRNGGQVNYIIILTC